ncbi:MULTISPECIES: TolC family protein [unclassified Flavobacterium]|jgi:outer membrane protein TolC|uniref:TolC family protein n=1 Tax=unclassified Flavobacterium TaxID=196869 RepID=UPI0025BC7FFA|nr:MULTISPECIES: TolC family protein [unclassified Flavobacterium]
MNLKLIVILFLCCIKSYSQEKDLNYFLGKAQTNSPLITDIKNQIHSASLDSLLFRATRKPQVSGNLLANYAPIIDDFGYDTALSNHHTVSGMVGVNQRILGANQINSQAETFKLIKDALVLNKKIAVKDLNKSIIAQYISTSASGEQIVYNQEIEKLLKQETLILKKLTQNSVYKQTDYLTFSATVQQQELVLLQLKQQYQNDLALLNYLSGETDTVSVSLKKPEITLKSIQNSDQIVFMKQFEIDSLKLQNQNKLIDNAYKPSLSLLGDAGYWSSFAYLPYKNIGFSLGLGLSIPIYDGHQRSLQHQKNETALATNLAYKSNFNRQYQQQLLMLNQKLRQQAEIGNQLQSQLVIAEALIEANKKLLPTGDAQITEFVIALGNLINIKNAISQNNINKLQIINEINYWSFNE